MNRPHLPPYKVEKLKGLRLLKELSNWAFKHWNIKQIWEHTQGVDVKVAVLDTGRPKHTDIEVSKSVDFTGTGPEDKNGHATWVCSCIAATKGFLGLAPKCKLYTAKILDNKGSGDWGWMKKGLEWALAEGCQVVNISAGGKYTGNEIQPILKKMADMGVLVVCAAGNANSLLIFPANDSNTIAIGAVNEQWQKAAFSNFGPRLIVMAPGVNLLGCWLNNGYAKASGTSMASPESSGILVLERELRSTNLKEAVAQFAVTSKDMEQEGWDPRTGWGIIDPFKFLGFEESGKKPTWNWLIALFFFLLFYFFGVPAAAVKKLVKGR